MNDIVRYELNDDVATLTMDDGKANAFGIKLTTALSGGLDRAAAEAKVVVIAGRPGMGKTSFALNVCQHVAIREARRDLPRHVMGTFHQIGDGNDVANALASVLALPAAHQLAFPS